MEENKEIEVSQIHTVCRDCVFARYDGKDPVAWDRTFGCQCS